MNGGKTTLTKEVFNATFKKYFELCKNEFISHLKQETGLKDTLVQRMNLLIDYNCQGGKFNRAFCLVSIVEKLCSLNGIPFDPNLERKAYCLACCIEVLQASLLIADDISDKSELRRGKPCWYKRKDVQLAAVNDAFLLESFVYFILRFTLGNEKNYTDFVFLYQDVILKTQIGQMIDLSFKNEYNTLEDMTSQFTKETFDSLIIHKTAYYTYYIPIASSLLLVDQNAESKMEVAKKVSVELGRKFQIQDDFIDCYSTPEMMGKSGKDIEENKCTWLIVNALNKASHEQKLVLMNHYGKDNKQDRDVVKKLYDELSLQEDYKNLEDESYQKIKKYIESNDSVIPKEVLLPLLEHTHLRHY